MSASSCVTYAYLGEFNTNKNRSTVIAFACIFAGTAYVYLTVAGYLILPATWSLYISAALSYRPWRLLLVANTLPGFVAVLCLSRLPESGKFLLTQGKEAAALDVLQRIYAMNRRRSTDTGGLGVWHLLPEDNAAAAPVTEKGDASAEQQPTGCLHLFWMQTVPLFKKPLRMNFLICCFLVFGVFFVSAGIGMWYPEIQNRIAHSPATGDEGRTVCAVLEGALQQRRAATALLHNGTRAADGGGGDEFGAACNDRVADSTFQDYGVLGGYYVLMYIVYASGIRRLGQGVFLVSFLFVSGAAGLALQWVAHPTAVVVLFSSHIVFSGTCISLLTGIVVALIPTEYR